MSFYIFMLKYFCVYHYFNIMLCNFCILCYNGTRKKIFLSFDSSEYIQFTYLILSSHGFGLIEIKYRRDNQYDRVMV
jgi:hypothetical protein